MRMRKSHFFLEISVLHEGSSFIESFVEHPVHSIFKSYSILILVFLFWFATINPKSIFLEILGAPRAPCI